MRRMCGLWLVATQRPTTQHPPCGARQPLSREYDGTHCWQHRHAARGGAGSDRTGAASAAVQRARARCIQCTAPRSDYNYQFISAMVAMRAAELADNWQAAADPAIASRRARTSRSAMATTSARVPRATRPWPAAPAPARPACSCSIAANECTHLSSTPASLRLSSRSWCCCAAVSAAAHVASRATPTAGTRTAPHERAPP